MQTELDTIEPPPQPSPPATFTRRGGCLGAIFIYGLSLAMITFGILPTIFYERFGWASLMTTESLRVILLAMVLSLVAAVVGYFAGREGARAKTVNRAFLWGGVMCGVATVICLVLQVLGSLHTESIHSRGYFTMRLLFFMIFTASGSLVSGLAAIVVRDRRESGRNRLIPQFTLQEIFILFTIASIIISALSSVAVLRL